MFTFWVAPGVLPFLIFFGRMDRPVDATSALEARLSELERKIERVEDEIAKVASKLEPLEEKPLHERDEREQEEIKESLLIRPSESKGGSFRPMNCRG